MRPLVRLSGLWSAMLCLAITTADARAQSLTVGTITGLVIDADGQPIPDAQVTLERTSGRPYRIAEASRTGQFRFTALGSGQYSLLVEQIGFQPVRRIGVLVAAGQQTAVSVVLVRKPPPITTIEEQVETASPSGITRGRFFVGRDLDALDRRRDIADLGRNMADVVTPFDGRPGFALSTAGLPWSQGRFVVDGVRETMLSHPGYPDQPAQTPVFGRDGIGQVAVVGAPVDAEWRGAPGATLVAETRRGGNEFRFTPYATFAPGKLAGSADNPADSSTTSFQVGAALSGAFVPDTAHFALRFGYQSLEEPASYSWERDAASLGGQAGSLRALLPSVATARYGTDVTGLVAPPVRTWKGGNGSGRVDWQIGPSQTLAIRAGFSSWKERSFVLGDDLGSGAGSELAARDGSGALSLTSGRGALVNELRAGFSMARREYGGAAIPSTTIVANGAGFGRSLGLPALFDRKTVDLSDAFQARAGSHLFKIGVSAAFHSYTQDYRFGSSGAFLFGDIDSFDAGAGAFWRVSGPEEQARFSSAELGAFLQDTWSISPEVQLLLGGRIDHHGFPQGKWAVNTEWEALTGERNDPRISGQTTLSPRIGFIWDVQNRGEWVVRGGGGIHAGSIDPTAVAEAILFDRDVEVRRAIATFADWPSLPGDGLTPFAGDRLTILNPSYRPPRSTKLDLGLARHFAAGLIRISAAYHHADYLLRREDRNRIVSSIATTQEGRPVYGSLSKQGGLIAAVPGSNRRFSTFDLVSILSPTGYSDYYEVAADLETRIGRHASFTATYTFSKTDDNVVGARSPDPTDQLSPFPEGQDGAEWADGRSDFDVPHRAAASLRLGFGERLPVTFTARYRIRSGLPFTPGFRPGVDVNADGSGNNDPAYLGGSITGLTEALSGASCDGSLTEAFAVRNSCREKIHQGLDLGLSIGLPVGARGDRVALRIDAFNLVSTATGIVDRALILVDPAGSITPGPNGTVSLPLVANPSFGTLLVRRGEPRIVRIGLRMEY